METALRDFCNAVLERTGRYPTSITLPPSAFDFFMQDVVRGSLIPESPTEVTYCVGGRDGYIRIVRGAA